MCQATTNQGGEMNKKDYSTLSKKYPAFCSFIGAAFECGIGWYDLLDDLIGTIAIIEPTMYATQIKEKYGGLRVYTSYSTDDVDDLIEEAERISYTICETCGKPGKLYDTGWMTTACEEHKPREQEE